MSLPEIADQEDWLTASKALLVKEKELTRQRDALSVERRNLPMVEVTTDYTFEGPGGNRVAARHLRGPPPADHLPLHVRPGLGGRVA